MKHKDLLDIGRVSIIVILLIAILGEGIGTVRMVRAPYERFSPRDYVKEMTQHYDSILSIPIPEERLANNLKKLRENPFVFPKESNSAVSGSTAPMRAILKLKGILMVDTAYAIIHDEKGKSHICRVGDTLQGNRVMAIQQDNVRLSDAAGTYLLAQ